MTGEVGVEIGGASACFHTDSAFRTGCAFESGGGPVTAQACWASPLRRCNSNKFPGDANASRTTALKTTEAA